MISRPQASILVVERLRHSELILAVHLIVHGAARLIGAIVVNLLDHWPTGRLQLRQLLLERLLIGRHVVVEPLVGLFERLP